MTHDTQNRHLRYGIRKFSGIGLVSALLGVGLVLPQTVTAATTEGTTIHYHYVAEEELTETERAAIVQSLPAEVTAETSYYLVYRPVPTGKLPQTNAKQSLLAAGIGTGFLVIAIGLGYKQRKVVRSILLLGAVGGSLAVTSVSALTVQLLAQYSHSVQLHLGAPLPNGQIEIPGYRFVGYLTDGQEQTADRFLQPVNQNLEESTIPEENPELAIREEELAYLKGNPEVFSESDSIENSFLTEELVSYPQDAKNPNAEIEPKLVPTEKDEPVQFENLTGIVTMNQLTVTLPVVYEEILSEQVLVAAESLETKGVKKSEPSTETLHTAAETVNLISTHDTVNQPSDIQNLESDASSPQDAISLDENEQSVATEAAASIESQNQITETERESRHVLMRTIRLTEELPSELIVTEDPDLKAGEIVVISPGQSGQRIRLQEVKMVDGFEVNRVTLSESIQSPTATHIRIGSKGAQIAAINKTTDSVTEEGRQTDKRISQESLTPLGYSETYYTELVTTSNSVVIREREKLEKLVKDVSLHVDLSSLSLDQTGAIKVITKYDETKLVSDRQITNIEAAIVTGSVKKRIRETGKEDRIETLLTKDIPQYQITVTIGTRQVGLEGETQTGKLVSVSHSDKTPENLEGIQVFESSYIPLQTSVNISQPVFVHSTNHSNHTAQIGLQVKRPLHLSPTAKPSMVSINEIDQTVSKINGQIDVYGEMVYAQVSGLDKGKNLAIIWEEDNQTLPKNKVLVQLDPSRVVTKEDKSKVEKSLALALVIDSSTSMRDYDPNNLRKSSASNLLNLLNLEKDLVAIVDFDSYVRNSTTLTSNKEDLDKAIKSINNLGGTNIFSGLNHGMNTLIAQNSHHNKLILLFTDGQDSPKRDLQGYVELSQKAKQQGIKIYTMGLGDQIDADLLRKLAEATDGHFFELADDASIRRAFSDITALLGREKSRGEKIHMTSTTSDIDGDGYDDALEKRKSRRKQTDDFNQPFDMAKWNVGVRDLLLFSDISYLPGNRLSSPQILDSLLEKLKDELKNDQKLFPHYRKLSLNKSDKSFFESWKLLGYDSRPYDDFFKKPLHSSVAWFYQENSKTLVIAFRGTDEDLDELFNDFKILLTTSKVESKAQEQIRNILAQVKDLDIENVYITGHSLGGYEAYYGALELAKSELGKKLKGGINFNGPGIHIQRLSDSLNLKQTPMRLLYTDQRSFNTLIVFGGIPTLDIIIDDPILLTIYNKIRDIGAGFLHPKKEAVATAYIKDEPYLINKLDIFTYAHKLTSFFRSSSQGRRSSAAYFREPHKTILDSLSKAVESIISGAASKISSSIQQIGHSVKESLKVSSATNIFEQLTGKVFSFPTRPGWSSSLKVEKDGSFAGTYHNRNGYSDDPRYHDIIYVSNFKGKFGVPVKVSDYEYKFGLTELSYPPVNQKTGKDKHLLVTVEPFGIKNSKNFTLYLPGMMVDNSLKDKLNQFLNRPFFTSPGILKHHILVNEEAGRAFATYFTNN